MPGLIVICGATATGKSSLALDLAQRLGSPILSADSRQVYREFDIGTAKPTAADRRLVPHYLLDICDPTENLTVADYQDRANQAIAEVHQRNQVPLLVGGTGLYLKAVVKGLKIPRVAPNSELRSQLAALGQGQCYAMLQQVDPESTTRIHAHDSVRTLRALEVFYVTGCPISQQQGENLPSYPILQIGLDCTEVQEGDRRILIRTQEMFEAGFVAEVESICDKYGTNLPLLHTLGYAEIKQYLAGKISLEEAKELTALHTRQFAKRQRTWFRGDRQIEWFAADQPDLLERVWNRIQKFLEPPKVPSVSTTSSRV
ncbi:tRNA (adenosine(37)-N6)-dimethylallyltransferase MiaA [Laspinema sp. A4]|uniref:tRNA (adenosine(37)-N6)-dimethylallyltransferase MiaA n=1 Tax=Laspinema sp. D2d TaxID=2953686 RepID=UPI0021BAD545|nr:tRNA (adenosine(37)-N6)-dimethylallyltransferase MiaA [Laspinema sp. D2d]MCT7985824.1 tRNA (adenosine(37)-N6)-dimethylallyltransferase MiaA [Laspinema sp. D2d]